MNFIRLNGLVCGYQVDVFFYLKCYKPAKIELWMHYFNNLADSDWFLFFPFSATQVAGRAPRICLIATFLNLVLLEKRLVMISKGERQIRKSNKNNWFLKTTGVFKLFYIKNLILKKSRVHCRPFNLS